MTRRGTFPILIGLAMWLPAAAGCFFTGSINREPRADVQVSTPGPHHRGAQVSFSAAKSDDPDGEPLLVSWRARPCNAARTDCDAVFEERTGRPLGEPFPVTIPARRDGDVPTEAILVEVTVEDPHGATHRDQVFVDAVNRAPAPALQLQGFAAPRGGYPIGTSVRAVAVAADPDGDPVTYEWRYFPASGSRAEDVSWERVDDAIYDLRADVIGEWEVEVTATDVLGASDTARAAVLMQRDEAPCIASTDPPAQAEATYIMERDGAPRRFAALAVADDLDVYPPPADTTPDGRPSPQGTARFHWFLSTPYTEGALRPISGHALAGYVIDPGGYAPGDTLLLRVEIEDRNEYDVDCDPALATCSLFDDETCQQRVTWRIEVR